MKPFALSGIRRKNLLMYSSEQNLFYDIYISSLVQMKGILAAKYSVVFLKMSYLLTSVNKTDVFLRLKNEKYRYLLPPPMTNISTGIVMYELYIDSVPISEIATQRDHRILLERWLCSIPSYVLILCVRHQYFLLCKHFLQMQSPWLHGPVRSIFT